MRMNVRVRGWQRPIYQYICPLWLRKYFSDFHDPESLIFRYVRLVCDSQNVQKFRHTVGLHTVVRSCISQLFATQAKLAGPDFISVVDTGIVSYGHIRRRTPQTLPTGTCTTNGWRRRLAVPLTVQLAHAAVIYFIIISHGNIREAAPRVAAFSEVTATARSCLPHLTSVSCTRPHHTLPVNLSISYISWRRTHQWPA